MTTARKPAAGGVAEEQRLKLGEIAVFNKILTQAQVDECLGIQAELAERGCSLKIGKILIEKFYLDRITLSAVLRAQASQRGIPPTRVDTSVDIIKFTPAEHDMLVERVRERKLISPEDLDRGIEIQMALDEHGIDKQLGEVCIELGILSRDVVSDVLARHETVRKSLVQEVVREPEAEDLAGDEEDEAAEGPGDDSGVFQAVTGRLESKSIRMSRQLRFGRLAVEKSLVTKEALEEALYLQFRMKELGIIKKLGEVLVEKGAMRPPDVRRVLTLQKQRLGRIRWSDLTNLGPVADEDRDLVRVVLEGGILSQEEVDECRFVQKYMTDLGLQRNLSQVFVDKEYLDAEVIEGIRKEQERKKTQAREKASAAAAEVGPSQVGQFTLKSVALEDAYREILAKLSMTEEEASQPEEPRRETLQSLATKKSPQRRAVLRNFQRLHSKPVWIALGVFSIPGIVAGGWVFFQARAENEAKREVFEKEREEMAAAIEDRQEEMVESRRLAAIRRQEDDLRAVLRMLYLLQSPDFSSATVASIEAMAERLADHIEETPYEADVEMLIGRAYFYQIFGSEFRLVERDVRKEWVGRAIQRLTRAVELYGRGAPTLVSAQAIDPETGADLAIHVAEWAPERRIYRAEGEACYDRETGTIDYKGKPEVAAKELRRILDVLARIQEDLDR